VIGIPMFKRPASSACSHSNVPGSGVTGSGVTG
jgi:hypothetical protein